MSLPQHHPTSRERLIVALDLPTQDEARAMVRRLAPAVRFYKIGLELVLAGGLPLVSELRTQGAQVFLDMKLLDIGNTVERAVKAAAAAGATFLSVHGHDRKTLDAAVAGRAGTRLKLLAVTVLTNLDPADLAQQGLAPQLAAAPAELVLQRARLAREAGLDGVVASGQEAARIRAEVGPDFLIVTPGIRLAGGAAGDQERITTPEHAIAAGADYLVVGRPITAADDPKSAAETFVQAIATAKRA
jgi:orotidine-5'-phosphate decarboxylase